MQNEVCCAMPDQQISQGTARIVQLRRTRRRQKWTRNLDLQWSAKQNRMNPVTVDCQASPNQEETTINNLSTYRDCERIFGKLRSNVQIYAVPVKVNIHRTTYDLIFYSVRLIIQSSRVLY